MEKSSYVQVIEGEDVRRDDSIEYFFPTGVGSTLSQKGNGNSSPHNEKIFGGGKNGGKKGVGSAIRGKRENGGSINIKE